MPKPDQPGERGDLIVEVKISFPSTLSQTQKAKFMLLYDLEYVHLGPTPPTAPYAWQLPSTPWWKDVYGPDAWREVWRSG
jgi:hypothetical protein